MCYSVLLETKFGRWCARVRGFVWLAILVCLSTDILAQGTNDRITQPSGTISGKITVVSPDYLTVSVANQTKQVAVASITRITLADDPPGLQSVRSSVEGGNLEQASRRISTMKPAVGSRDVVKQDIAYYQALVNARLAMKGTGTVTAAVRQMVDFLKKNPRSFRFYAACEVLGDLAMNLERYDTAASYYKRIDAAQSRALKTRSRILQGYAWLRQGDADKSASLFEQAVSSEDDRLKALGQIGLASCRAKQGRPEEGIEMVEKIIAENDATDVELFARAYNAQGRCFEAAQKNEDAVLAYLHTDMLFYRDFDAHAEALFRLSKLWPTINKPAEATKTRQLLKRVYAATPWAKK